MLTKKMYGCLKKLRQNNPPIQTECVNLKAIEIHTPS